MLGQVLGGMMGKLAVGRSIARAYGFLFGRIFTVLGIAWMGTVLYGGLALLTIRHLADLQTVHDATLAGHAWAALWHLAVVLVSLLIVASIAIPLTREALDEGGEFVFAQFVLGARELRYFLALIRLGVIVIAILAAGGFAASEIPAGAKWAAAQWPQLQTTFAHWPVVAGLQIGLCAAALLSALVLALRFGFLLKAVAAVEHRASLSRAWALSRGNTLRILLVVVLAAIPAYLVLFAIAYALVGQPLLDACRALLTTAIAAKPAAVLLALYAAHGGAFAALAALKLLLLVGLMAGAGAEAYRALTADEDDDGAHEPAAHHHEAPAPSRHDVHHYEEPPPEEPHHEEPALQAPEPVHHAAARDDEPASYAPVAVAAHGFAYEGVPATVTPAPAELPPEDEAVIVAEASPDAVPGDEALALPDSVPGFQHDDDESCACGAHALPAHTPDDPHDAHIFDAEPEETPLAAAAAVHSGEDEGVLELR
ncbi:MAG: hypothetical protein KGL66_02980 [Alphaproteobacteria bacterium]|nr:hypothetical protein [Alphaproteobacteria bacterium]